VFWFILNTPYLLIEKYGWFSKYKIQKNQRNSAEEFQSMFVQMLKEHAMFMLPACLVISAVPITRRFIILDWAALPSVGEAVVQGKTT
jgi:hypothetical protein